MTSHCFLIVACHNRVKFFSFYLYCYLGDILKVSHFRSWEWNHEKPTRTVVFPFISSGLPFMLLKATSSYFGFKITPHLLLLLPRLWMTFQSLAIDHLIYRLTFRLFQKEDIANVASIIFASSYTCWVYCTRTFSNCTETILLGLLLDLVTREQPTEIKKSNGSSDLQLEQFGDHEQLINLEKSKNKNSLFISAIAVFGFFIRISFLGFALIPVAYWLLEGLFNLSLLKAIKRFFIRSFLLIPGAIISTIAIILIDCAYFKYNVLLQFAVVLQQKSLTKFFEWARSLPITPLNSLEYNLDVNNLEKHGLHPWFFHLTINLPLMFSPLIYALIPALSVPRKFLNCPRTKGNAELLLLLVQTIFFSLSMLTFIAHQEPRFLLPLVIPVAVLLSRCLHPFSSHKFLVILWILFNIFCYGFYALFHQAGLVPTMDFVSSLAKVHNEKHSYNKNKNIDILFYKTYMPPVHLAGISKQSSADSGLFQVIDLAGSSYEKLEETLNLSLTKVNSDVYLVLPASLPCNRFKRLRQTYLLKEQFTVFPHLSIEDPPWFAGVCWNVINSSNYFLSLTDRMTLAVFKVKLLKNAQVPDVPYAIYSPKKVHSSTS